MQRIAVLGWVTVLLGAYAVARGQVVVGLDEGGAPVAKVYSAFNPAPPLGLLQPTTPGFWGGVRVAVGDINGDGAADAVTGLGPGAPSEVKVYSGMGNDVLASFQPPLLTSFAVFDRVATAGFTAAFRHHSWPAAPPR